MYINESWFLISKYLRFIQTIFAATTFILVLGKVRVFVPAIVCVQLFTNVFVIVSGERKYHGI